MGKAGTSSTPQQFMVYSRREKGQGKGKGISNVWGLAAADIENEDTCPELVTKRESLRYHKRSGDLAEEA